jgi:hypothetical protein
MTRNRFLLTLAAFVASLAHPARAQKAPPFDPPPAELPPKPGKGGPAPLLGAGLPAIISAGAALVGYRLWRRKRRSPDDLAEHEH